MGNPENFAIAGSIPGNIGASSSLLYGKIFSSGIGVWVFNPTNNIFTQHYTESPYNYASWMSLKSNITTSTVSCVWHDAGSFVFASPSGAVSALGAVASIQLSMAALPSSGLATIGAQQNILAGSITLAQWPSTMVSTDSRVWYATRIIKAQVTSKGTDYDTYDFREGKS